MKKHILFFAFFMLLCLSANRAIAQCPSYESAYPPPYPSNYPCVDWVLDNYTVCCNVEFNEWCIQQLKTHCNLTSNLCYFEQCKSTGCVQGPNYPYCPGGVCPSYTSPYPPPGPNPPQELDGIIYEITFFDGRCCMEEWDNLCWGATDSIGCLVCEDNNPATINGCSPLLGCTYTPVPISAKVEVKARVLLEGAYIPASQGMMRTNLRSNNDIPLTQPFNQTPWSYTGTQSYASTSAIPDNAVDWILVELRDAKDKATIVGRAAGILLSNGQVRSAADTSKGVRVDGVLPNQNYYVVLRARNHVAVMSNIPVFLSAATPFDFTYDVSQAMGTSQMTLVETYDPNPSVPFNERYYYAMKAGDHDGNGKVQIGDFLIYKNEASAIRNYKKGDCNFDGNVTFVDYNYYRTNSNFLGYSLIQY